MNLTQLKVRVKAKDTPKAKVELVLQEVMEGVYGTKNRVKLILRLNYIKDML